MDFRMPTSPDSSQRAVPWRWIALVAVVGNVAFDYLYDRVGVGPDLKSVSDRYATLVTPASYAFAIWGVIYAGFLAFAVVELRAAQRRRFAYERLAPLLAAANVLGSLWILAFTHDLVWPSLGVIALTLAIAATLYARAHRLRATAHLAWLRAPFALFLGWILVATLANLGAALAAVDLGVSPMLAAAFIVIAALAALAICTRTHDPIVPGVVAWALIAIADRAHDASVTGIALIAGIVCALASASILMSRGWLPATSHRVT
jgi:hypothetical protein